jgi:hypothetical protein
MIIRRKSIDINDLTNYVVYDLLVLRHHAVQAQLQIEKSPHVMITILATVSIITNY